MSVALLASLLVAAALAPNLLDAAALRPVTGIVLSMSALVLRATLVVLGATAVALYAPGTELFHVLTHWCVHAVVPFLAAHLGFSGHRVADAAAALPGLILALSAMSAFRGVLGGTRSVRRWLQRGALGPGPEASVIVGGEDVLVAAAGVRGAKVVVSTGALAMLDENELAASLAHEHGHISRHHPYVALAGTLAFGLARLLPGSAAAHRRLHFFIERDADEFAVARTQNPLALASAICKVADRHPASASSPELARLSGCGAPARLRLLLDRSAARPRSGIDLAARALAVLLAGLVLAVGLLTPTLARAGVAAASHSGERQHLCED